MNKPILVLLCTATLAGCVASASAAMVIPAARALVRTDGGPLPDGGWNLWTSGRVGQPVRITDAEAYQVVVRAFGSPAAEVWPQMALLVDGRTVRAVIVDCTTWTDYRFEVELPVGESEQQLAGQPEQQPRVPARLSSTDRGARPPNRTKSRPRLVPVTERGKPEERGRGW